MSFFLSLPDISFGSRLFIHIFFRSNCEGETVTVNFVPVPCVLSTVVCFPP